MNHNVPQWSMEGDYRPLHAVFPPANQGKFTRPDHELVELLWQNGHVVMHSQTHLKTTTSLNEVKQCQRPEAMLKCGGPLENQTKITDEEETSPWLQYPLEDSLDKEFCLDLYGLPIESPTIDKIKDVTTEGEKFGNYGTTEENSMEYIFKQTNGSSFEENMTPPKSQAVTSFPQTTDTGDVMNFSHFSRSLKTDLGPLNAHLGEKNLQKKNKGEVGDPPSSMTKEASICGSNQVQGQFNMDCSNAVRVSTETVVKEDAQTGFSNHRAHTDTHETTVTSSSGGLGCSFGRTDLKSASTKSHKRKGRDDDESEIQSEEAEHESVEGNRQSQRSASARRSRAAEVHNLAERRRRDRINEKMRALQDLIPHCNKSDKASMLDEAIEYLKSLQLQLQMMWMGSSMAAMMFPGMQHYMSHIGMGIGHGSMASIHGPINFPRVPVVNQSMSSNLALNQVYQASMSPSPFACPVNLQNHTQNPHLPESYAHYLGFHHMQPSPQAMNLYGSLSQQNQMALAAGGSARCDPGAPSENTQNVKTG